MVRRAKVALLFSVGLFLIFHLSGCSYLWEGAKGIAGISTRELERARRDALTKELAADYFSCYTKVLDILKRTGSYVYKQDVKGRMIAIYVSSTDTTPVGLFFKESGPSRTLIEVSSPSTYAKELIAERVFRALEKDVE